MSGAKNAVLGLKGVGKRGREGPGGGEEEREGVRKRAKNFPSLLRLSRLISETSDSQRSHRVSFWAKHLFFFLSREIMQSDCLHEY